MSDSELRQEFAARLKYYMNIKGCKQSDIARDLGINMSTISSWCNGVMIPRMEKIKMLADYFNINMSDLLEDDTELNNKSYYINDDAKDIAQFLYENPDYKVLFDASRKVKKEDIQFVKDMIDRLSKMNNGR